MGPGVRAPDRSGCRRASPSASVRFGDPVNGANTLSHFSRANVSYLAPLGTGLKIRAGLFNSYIGYESFYAKDNFNYTRSFLPDYTPYFMFGISADYQFNEEVTTAFYVINGTIISPSPTIFRATELRSMAMLTVRDRCSEPLLRAGSNRHESAVLALLLG